MKLSMEAKAQRARQRMIEHARKYSLGTYSRKYVAPLFQRMIRAEAGADLRRYVTAVVDGLIRQVERKIGQCVCVTCGNVNSWKGGVDRYSGMHTGHFLASRRNSILFEETNCAPQCSHCNFYRSGEQQLFRKWMIAVRGQGTVERLERLKNETRTFTREELVDMRISYAARLKAAEMKMMN